MLDIKEKVNLAGIFGIWPSTTENEALIFGFGRALQNRITTESSFEALSILEEQG